MPTATADLMAEPKHPPMYQHAEVRIFLVEKNHRELGKAVFAELKFHGRVIGEVYGPSPSDVLKTLSLALEAAGAAQ